MSRFIWILLLIPLLSLTVDSDKPCKPLKSKHKIEKFINSLQMDLNYTTNFTTIWDSIEQVIRVKDSVWRSENSEPPHIFEPPLQRPPNRASFTGGNERFYEYVKNRIMVCNLLLKEVKKTKKYTFQFRVNQQGNIDEANVTEGLNSRFSTEVKNILLQSPKWIPSLINGKFINTEYKFTISIVVAH